ncbi:C40 family peptidase [Aquimarina sp. RZ0]|uniref:C40 family peptidase n=1 Tax=Aquimarina sp. RZ0 TaxID=2607730 RepID=UPI0011F216DF|nr:C40 family peptidase [Aquimarina sp. RZ0]KAA1247412.1 NlpC/P60 family protein [Aquimarina sp. RZ0]
MKKTLSLLLLFCILLSSCGSTKKRGISASKKANTHTKSRKTTKAESKKIIGVIKYAKTFEGTRYKYGGTTKKGMDCSGLVYTSFKKNDIVLPRTSRAMASQGTKISLKNVAPGDLLFFKTNKNKNVINHVGLVVTTGNQVQFIHASTSKGVTISSLNERYWSNCFVTVRRVL